MKKSNIIDKIKKLFALGDKNRNPNEGEVKTALAMASKLMKEHNVGLSEISLENKKSNITEEKTAFHFTIAFWERKLAEMVGKLFDCDPIITESYRNRQRGYLFVGFEDEVKLAVQCYEYLSLTIKMLAKAHAKHKMDFYAGITDRLQERIDEEIKLRTPKENSKCKAIVCCKNQLIKKWEEKNLKLTTEHRRNPTINEVSEDYVKGYLAGNNIDLQNKEKIK